MKYLPLLLLLLLCTCAHAPRRGTELGPPAPSSSPKVDNDLAWKPYDESAEIAENANHESQKLRYKLLQSRITDRNVMLNAAKKQLGDFSAADYERLKPLIYEQNIPSLQARIPTGALTYELITKWFLYRIVKFESNQSTYLNAIISINPDAVEEARKKDMNRGVLPNLIFGLPVLLKDNVNFAGLPTTAGADALRENETKDAYITTRLKANGAIILGKTNLSEWANFLCDGCPNGYSAVGGQTLNAYGRRVIDTGGSSSGSGVAIAANYAVAAVGTETSGSILSPSSQSSLVGLKPTVGLLSRTGIVPISSTLDTPGPMTRSVIDNAIMLSAMSGADPNDEATVFDLPTRQYLERLDEASPVGKRFGVIRRFLDNPLYVLAVNRLVGLGADTVVYDPPVVDLSGFLSLLNGDMKTDLPAYLKAHAGPEVMVSDAASVIKHNLVDTIKRSPYGMARFYGIEEEDITGISFAELKSRLNTEGTRYFSEPMEKYRLDAVLSINNYSAGFAAVARYPALTVPMGYDEEGKPYGLTFIGRPFSEEHLLMLGYGFEQGNGVRKAPF